MNGIMTQQDRKQQILSLLKEKDYRHKEMARLLGICYSHVKKCYNPLLKEYGAKNKKELTMILGTRDARLNG